MTTCCCSAFQVANRNNKAFYFGCLTDCGSFPPLRLPLPCLPPCLLVYPPKHPPAVADMSLKPWLDRAVTGLTKTEVTITGTFYTQEGDQTRKLLHVADQKKNV